MKFILLLALFSSSLYAGTREDTTISGISAGGFMAVQMQLAFSDKIGGMASLAGGPYWCAENGESLMGCLQSPEDLDVAKLVQKARDDEKEGLIAPLDNLRTTKTYLYQSRADSVVRPESTEKLFEFLQAFQPKSAFKVQWLDNAAHAFPTANFGSPCETTGSPFIVNCALDAAGDLLQHLYGRLKAPATPKRENLRPFSQKEFSEAGLYETGWVYMPEACRKGGCRVHMTLHGCAMGPDFIKDEYRWNAGFNSWAEANNIVIIYPSVAKSLGNPYGCWDWFGYTDEHYLHRNGKQMMALMKIFKNYSL